MSIGGKGIRDWLIQRATAVWLLAVCVFFIYYFFTQTPIDYKAWRALFSLPLMKLATVVTILALVLHAWIGLWTVVTDYIHKSFLRLIVLGAIILALLGYMVWTFMILWGL